MGASGWPVQAQACPRCSAPDYLGYQPWCIACGGSGRVEPKPLRKWVWFPGPDGAPKSIPRKTFDRALVNADATMREVTRAPVEPKLDTPVLPAIGPVPWHVTKAAVISLCVAAVYAAFVGFLAYVNVRAFLAVALPITPMCLWLAAMPWIWVKSDIRWDDRSKTDPRTPAEQWRDFGRLVERIAREI